MMSDEKTYMKIEIPQEEEEKGLPAARTAEKTRLNELGDQMAEATRQLGDQAAAAARQAWREKGRPAVRKGLRWGGRKVAEQSGKVTTAVTDRVTAEVKREMAEMPAKLTRDNVQETATTAARHGLRWLSQALARLAKRLEE
ncbi:MAG: hypothetical protein KC418_13005 [Anaerolineales bacterium]|nr:hypothetical protein [Anaerolineales bacterium]MCB8954031.1 hypothetical protein [Ardenticatenales bacterium]